MSCARMLSVRYMHIMPIFPICQGVSFDFPSTSFTRSQFNSTLRQTCFIQDCLLDLSLDFISHSPNNLFGFLLSLTGPGKMAHDIGLELYNTVSYMCMNIRVIYSNLNPIFLYVSKYYFEFPSVSFTFLQYPLTFFHNPLHLVFSPI